MPQKNKDENNSTKRIVREVEELRKRNVELEFYKKEYKRLKEAEQERTERYGIIFEEVAVSIVVVDKEGRIVDVNSHHIINIGKGKTNKDDYLGKSILTHSSVVNAGLVEQYKGVLEGEILHKTDVYFPSTTGGTDAYFNVRGKPILKDGKIIGAVFTHEDVTKRKQAEDELKAHGYQLEKLIEERTTRLQQEIDERKQVEEDLQASVLELRIRNEILEIFHTTPDEQVYGELLKLFLEVFKSKYGTFGYFDQEGSFVIPSMTRDIYWQKCRVPDKEIIFKKATFSGIWARAIKEKKTLYLNDGPFSIPEGHIPIKNTMVSPIIFRDQVISAIHLANKETDYDEGDRGLLETIADYVAPVLNARLERDRLERERRRTEQAVLRSEERLAHAQGIAHVGCWEIDLNLQVGWWSDELYRIFGVDPGDVTVSRESVGKLIPPGDLAVMNAAYEAAVTHGEPINLEHRLVRPDGSERWVHVVGRLERNVDGAPVRLFGTTLNITERKKTENELERLYELTRKDAEIKTILLQEINHRVKNNLAMISSLMALQSESIKDPEAELAFENTRQRIHSMAIIHEKMYQSEHLLSINAREYFNSIITELNKAYGSLQRLTNINVKVDDVSLPLKYAVPSGLILNELLTNALKHSFPDGQTGEIMVEFHKRNNRFVLSVGDNGVGLPDEVDFRKAKSMGLQLINILTQQLKGEINLDQSKGTLFKITFPATR